MHAQPAQENTPVGHGEVVNIHHALVHRIRAIACVHEPELIALPSGVIEGRVGQWQYEYVNLSYQNNARNNVI